LMKKLTKLFGVGLVVILLVSLFGFAAPVSAGTLSWSAESGIPSTTGKVIATATSNISDIAASADGQTIWVVTSTTTAYKSTNGGKTWSGKTVDEGFDLIAISPTDKDIVIGACSGNASVYLTTDGGTDWDELDTPQEGSGATAAILKDVAISPQIGSTSYITVAGVDSTSTGNIWYLNLGATLPAWTEIKDKDGYNVSTDGAAASSNECLAIAFSPNFISDRLMAAVIVDDTTGSENVSLQLFSFSSSKKWNESAGFDDYPVKIFDIEDGASNPTANFADIAMAPTYLGSDEAERTLFVAITIDGDNETDESGLWRLKDTTTKKLKDQVYLFSAAYDGDMLVAGALESNAVYYCDDALSSSVTVSSARSLKRPGGAEYVKVVYAGDTLCAGTRGDESAFAISELGGKAWNDISLVSSDIEGNLDLAISADGSVMYWLTADADSSHDISLWRMDGDGWKRVLSLPGETNDYIVRISPDDADIVYVAEVGSTTLYYSNDGGTEMWFTRASIDNITDMAVEGNSVAYILNEDDEVSKTENNGFTWGSGEDTGISGGFMIISAMEDAIIVGGSGEVAWSLDGNDSWDDEDEDLGSGNMIVAADSDFANNETIYAAPNAASGLIYRFVIGDDAWDEIISAAIGGTIEGLASMNGYLYAVEDDATANSESTLWQCLSPTTADDETTWGDKDSSSTANVSLANEGSSPQSLVASNGKLWAVGYDDDSADTIQRYIYSFTDGLAGNGPALIAPTDKYSNKVNNLTGEANELVFTWSRLSKATDYKLYIYYDASFDEEVTTVTITDNDDDTVVQAVGPNRSGDAEVNWQLGQTYYWRVKVTQPLYSSYSETRSFTIEPGVALVPAILAPINGTSNTKQKPSFSWSPVSGTAQYRFILANNPQLTAPIVDITTTNTAYAMTTVLAYGETYYWAVKSLAPVEGGWSAIANFTVMSEPVAPTPPVVIQEVPAPIINIPAAPPAQEIVIPPAPAPPAQIAPAYIWAIIVIGAILVIAVIILIVRTRRTV